MPVGRGVTDGAAVGGAVVGAVAGGAVAGAVLAGAADVGAAVLVLMLALGDADADGVALAKAEGAAPEGARTGRPRTSTPITSRVSSPPATPASARSIQRGPCRGGGMIFVVSDMSGPVAGFVPPRRGLCETLGRVPLYRSDEALRVPLDAELAWGAHVAEERGGCDDRG